MKNRCVYTKEIMQEYHFAALFYYYKKLIISILVILLLAFINLISKLIMHSMEIHTVFFVIIPPILLVTMVQKEKRAVRLEEERMLVVYGKKDIESIVDLCDVIRITTENENKREVSYNHIVAYKETKNLIVIILEGRIFVPLSKKGFIDGDAESCRKLLDSKSRIHNGSA